MFKFVEYEAHPQLKTLTELYRRLRAHTDAALAAHEAERRAHKELKDIPNDQQRIPTVAHNGICSSTHDFSDPKYSGFSPKYTDRNTTWASALLNARVRRDELYESARAMQQWLGTYREAFFQMRDADKCTRLQMDLLDHNVLCAIACFKDALDALSKFSVYTGINWHDECPILQFDQDREVSNFRGQWCNWLKSIPELPAVSTVDERREAHLLVQLLAARDDADRGIGEARVQPHEHVSPASRNRVMDWLHQKNWLVHSIRWIQNAAVDFITVSRPSNSHAPFIRPLDNAKRRRLFRS